MKLSDFVVRFIAETGTRHVFFLPGGACMHLVDSLGRNSRLQTVCCLHEQAAVIAAESYSQFTNRLGVALVTAGPGSTNAITGVAGAWIDSTPLLVVSGQAKRSDLAGTSGVRQMGIQEVNIAAIAQPITKYAVTIMDPQTIKYHLQKAYYLATHGRKGPVWIDIPLDVQGSNIDEDALHGFSPDDSATGRLSASEVSQSAKAVAKLISAARRPVVLAGNGVRQSNAIEPFNALIDLLKMPVLLTWKASDMLWETHGLYCGKPGIIGQRAANFTQQNADFLLCIGARLDLCQVGYDHANFASGAKKAIVDIDKAEIDKLKTAVDVRIPADAGLFLRELLGALAGVSIPDFSSWLARCKAWQKKYPVVLDAYRQSTGLVNTYFLMDVLSDVLNEDDVIVPGSSGGCAEITQQALRLKKGQRMLNTPGLGSMGFCLPASLGACLASDRRRTIGIVGDGGLQHNIQEFETLARLNVPVKLFVLNNNGYASIRNMQRTHFKGTLVGCDPSSGLTLPDTCSVAQAYGLQTKKIKNQENLARDVGEVLAAEGPIVCEVMTDPNVQTAPRMSSVAMPDGTMVSKPFEDLWPFLDREEFKANMTV
jgi:acetolactate synthase-1/2/3 large subunit